MRLFKYICIFLTGIAIAVIFYGGVNYMAKVREAKKGEEQRKKMFEQILDAVKTGPEDVEIDFNKEHVEGSPLVFGGASTPLINQQDAWNKLENIGVTIIRTDFGINRMITNTTIDDYKNNSNNINSIDNWNKQYMQDTRQKFIEAKKRNMKTMGIVDYTPPWLSHDNTNFGVPIDWNIFKDIVKKTYSYYRNELDYVEIWNEPTYSHFLNVENSGYSREEAYRLIFKNAVEAIREVDSEINDGKRMKIGAPTSHTPFDTSLLEALLADPKLNEDLDFVSYHNYDYQHLSDNSDIYFKELLTKYGKPLPIFLTEWNHSTEGSEPDTYNSGENGILYTSYKMISFLKMGLMGANYFMMGPVPHDGSTNNENFFGFYKWIKDENKAILKPQYKSWLLFSRKMGLGAGSSKIYYTSGEFPPRYSVGYINQENEKGAVIINTTEEKKLISLTFRNPHLSRFANMIIYETSESSNPNYPIYSGLIETKDVDLNIKLIINKKSVLGIKLTDKKNWYDVFSSSMP